MRDFATAGKAFDGRVNRDSWVIGPNPTRDVRTGLGAVDDMEELDIFHYHKAVIPTNYFRLKTPTGFYHDFMHYFNRVTGFNDEYFARKNVPFDNGHVNVSSFTVNYG